MRFIAGLPLLVIPVAAYFVMVFITNTPINDPVYEYLLPSGVALSVTWEQVLIGGGLLLFYIEIFKATRSGGVSMMDHLLSLVLLAVCVVAMAQLPEMATGTFLILTVMTLIDVLAGFTVSMFGNRRVPASAHS